MSVSSLRVVACRLLEQTIQGRSISLHGIAAIQLTAQSRGFRSTWHLIEIAKRASRLTPSPFQSTAASLLILPAKWD